MAWSHVFLVSILSDLFFSNTFKYLWNLQGTIFSTILISIKSFSFLCFSSIILAISVFFSTVSFLNSFFFSFCLFSFFYSFFLYFCHSGFVCFTFHCFPHSSCYFYLPSLPINCSMLAIVSLISYSISIHLSHLSLFFLYALYITITPLLYTLSVLYD